MSLGIVCHIRTRMTVRPGPSWSPGRRPCTPCRGSTPRPPTHSAGLPNEVVDALVEAAMLRILTPRRYGCYQMDGNTGARPAALNPFVGYEVFYKSLLGVNEPITTML
jgi:hypothetical protein